jgi:hypothetical protein
MAHDDYQKGRKAAQNPDRDFDGENQSRAFWDGYQSYMSEVSLTEGNPDLDTFDGQG